LMLFLKVLPAPLTIRSRLIPLYPDQASQNTVR
jgi:hypothetical protein